MESAPGVVVEMLPTHPGLNPLGTYIFIIVFF